MQVALCRLRTHHCCFILFNIVLFHALLFGADFLEEYFLRSLPSAYTDGKFLEIRERARTLNLSLQRENISKSYVISGSERCAGRDVFLLLIIFSSPENRIRRERIRQTWANVTALQGPGVTALQGPGVTRVFMLGRPQGEDTQSSLLNESRLHQDLVQGSFLDASPNKALKAAMMVEWVVTFCPGARFILKAEEQVFVNVQSLSRYLLSLEVRTTDVYTGRVIRRAQPHRDPHSPSFVPLSSYSEPFFPDYCSGSAMVLSQEVMRKMYLVSGQVTEAVSSEVFIGLSAQRVGVLPIHSSQFSGDVQYNRCCYRVVFSSRVSDDQMSAVWTDLSGGQGCSRLQMYYGRVSCRVRSYLDRIRSHHSEEEENGA